MESFFGFLAGKQEENKNRDLYAFLHKLNDLLENKELILKQSDALMDKFVKLIQEKSLLEQIVLESKQSQSMGEADSPFMQSIHKYEKFIQNIQDKEQDSDEDD